MNRNSLSTSQELRKGDFLMSENGEYKACFQNDGNFVIYKWPTSEEIWASNTKGSQAYRLILQDDSNLVMRDNNNKSIWHSGTWTNRHSNQVRLTLTNYGQLVLDTDGKINWIELRKGEFLMSENGQFKAWFKNDGNFVIYKWPSLEEIWASDTNGEHAYRLILQDDSNLVIYDNKNSPIWHSNTWTNRHSDHVRLTLTNYGQLVLDTAGKTAWTAGQ
ncbi:Comitin [Merluccius polli]|uniref:Comitin n=1 Tax=Merluccius polli TaxID=89951 RepID=A0AA47P4C9_MERPO|nr:Comitin [Merluccius polli]